MRRLVVAGLAVVLVATGCSDRGEPPPEVEERGLVGDVWLLDSLVDADAPVALPAEGRPYLQFNHDRSFVVTSSGISYPGGTYELNGDELVLESPRRPFADIQNLRPLDDGRDPIEFDDFIERFDAAWAEVGEAELDFDLLTIVAGDVAMSFRRIERPDWPIEGTRWMAGTVPALGAGRGVRTDTVLVFDLETETLIVEGACLRTESDLTVDGDWYVADPLSTDDVCPEDATRPTPKRTQAHQEVLAFLADGFALDVAVDEMWLEGTDGTALSLRRIDGVRFAKNDPLGLLPNDVVLRLWFADRMRNMEVDVLGSGRLVATRSDLPVWETIGGKLSDDVRDDFIAAFGAVDVRELYRASADVRKTCNPELGQLSATIPYRRQWLRFRCEIVAAPDEALFEEVLAVYHEIRPLITDAAGP